MMQPGDCFNMGDMHTTNNQYAYVTDCSTPHDSEVYATGAVTSTSYPTDDGWAQLSSEVCDPAFLSYVGIEWTESTLKLYKLYPDEETWDNELDQRQMVCFAYDSSGIPLTASIKGSRR